METNASAVPAAAYPRFLERISEEDKRKLLSSASQKTYAGGSLIFSQDYPIDQIFIVQQGRVKTFYTTSGGQSITLAYWHDGMLMGVPGISDGFVHMWSAEAVGETKLLQLPRSMLLQLVDQSSAAARVMIELLEFKSKHLSRLTQILATGSVAERLRIVLLNLCDLYGVPDSGGTRIELPLTHAEIGEMVGASRQWVTVTLGKMEKAGILSSKDRQIVLARNKLSVKPRQDEPL